ncbi:hypothetical protein BDA99DRAFT_540159 [Phascolomyces articulosus]|uniref:Uncharacterized protein n=1 Tax=Phascolomyces articulosus TaxID=60185 RepID=A0AAD5PBM1_9FUNG|nr:hypothetical protein BDA99DRAFT_540159 [Phascolomyces articulosus]
MAQPMEIDQERRVSVDVVPFIVVLPKELSSVNIQDNIDHSYTFNRAFTVADAKPFARENQNKSLERLHDRRLVVDNDQTSFCSLLCNLLNNMTTKTPIVYLLLGENNRCPIKGLLALTAIAHVLSIKVYVFSTSKSPVIIRPSFASSSLLALLHHADSFASTSAWVPLSATTARPFISPLPPVIPASPTTEAAHKRSDNEPKARKEVVIKLLQWMRI